MQDGSVRGGGGQRQQLPFTLDPPQQGCLQVGTSLVLVEYNKGNHGLVREHTLVVDKSETASYKMHGLSSNKNSNNPNLFYYQQPFW